MVLSVVPIVSLAALFLMSLNQKKGVLTAKAYKQAGGETCRSYVRIAWDFDA